MDRTGKSRAVITPSPGPSTSTVAGRACEPPVKHSDTSTPWTSAHGTPLTSTSASRLAPTIPAKELTLRYVQEPCPATVHPGGTDDAACAPGFTPTTSPTRAAHRQTTTRRRRIAIPLPPPNPVPGQPLIPLIDSLLTARSQVPPHALTVTTRAQSANASGGGRSRGQGQRKHARPPLHTAQAQTLAQKQHALRKRV